MSRAKKIIQRFGEQDELVKIDPTMPMDAVSIEQTFMKRMANQGIEGITVDQVDVDLEGDIVVHFKDENDDEMAVLFMVDQEDGIIAMILDEDPDSDEITIIELDPLNPVVRKTNFGPYVDLTNLDWMNKSSILAILQAGAVDPAPPKKKPVITQDAFGHTITSLIPNESMSEISKIVVRGGKKIKLPVVRRKRRIKLTTQQKLGLRKAGLARKRNKVAIGKKLKKSLKVRKRLGLKKAAKGFSKKFKIGSG